MIFTEVNDYEKTVSEKEKPACHPFISQVNITILCDARMWHLSDYENMDYKVVRNTPVCLECGDKIRYGRTDKKFCCEECRNRHHNRSAGRSRIFRRKVMRVLDRNYAILDHLIRSDITSIDITDIIAMGFMVNVMTSCRIQRRHVEYCCFDIKYVMTPARVTSISKIQNVSVPLQPDFGNVK